MNNKHTAITLLVLVLASFAVGVFVYPLLPATVASHWNSTGNVNGYLPKFWGAFLVPIMSVALLFLAVVIPKIDPLAKNIATFRTTYNMFWVVIIAFLLYVHALTLAWNLGYRFNFTTFMIPALAVLWYAIGSLLSRSKRNWFVGIRTPWTLSDDVVWEKTHRLGGRLFRWTAVLLLLGLFFRDRTVAIMLFVVTAVGIAIVTVVYSYVIFRRENHASS